MPEPIVPDHHETDEETDDLLPLLLQRVAQLNLRHRRKPDSDDEQGHRDGKHRVAEEPDAIKFKAG